jgi:hypothetical protein
MMPGMPEKIWNRRAVLAMVSGASTAGVAGAGAAVLAASVTRAQAQQVPWSSGMAPAKTKAPPNAADCHHHIYSSRFRVDPNSSLRPDDASVADYRLLQKRIGTSRNVVVQHSTYGIFNDGLIEALGEFGGARRRAASPSSMTVFRTPN